MTEFKKLKDLISAIEEGNYNNVETALNAGKTNGHIKSSIVNLKDKDGRIPLNVALGQPSPDPAIIKLLIENGAYPDMEDSNRENAWCVTIKNRKLKGIFSEQAEFQLSKALEISYRYSGPLNDTKRKVNRDGDNYLHIAARAGNKEAFVTICKKNIASITVHNEDGNNPFHEAARSGILLPIVKDIFDDLNSEASKKIKKVEKDKNWKELRELKEELKCNKKYIKDALCSKDHAFNKKRETPLYYLDAREQKEIKQTADIQDKLICNKNFHLCLYIAGAIACTVTLCMSLYFLSLASQPFALSSLASMAFAGVTYLSLKACSEIYNLHNEGTSVQDLEVMSLSEGASIA